MQLYDFITSGKEAFKEFKKANKDINITRQEYADIIVAINNAILDQITDGKPFTFSWGLGIWQVKKKLEQVYYIDRATGEKRFNLRTDFNATKKLWENSPEAREKKKKIYFLNTHTEGYKCKFYWKPTHSFSFKTCWDFKTGRYAARELARVLKTRKGSIHNFENK